MDFKLQVKNLYYSGRGIFGVPTFGGLVGPLLKGRLASAFCSLGEQFLPVHSVLLGFKIIAVTANPTTTNAITSKITAVFLFRN